MPVTLFSQDQLATAVAAALPLVPDGHTNAVIGIVDAKGVQVIVTMKLGDHDRWQATGYGRHEWTGDNQVGASLVYSW